MLNISVDNFHQRKSSDFILVLELKHIQGGILWPKMMSFFLILHLQKVYMYRRDQHTAPLPISLYTRIHSHIMHTYSHHASECYAKEQNKKLMLTSFHLIFVFSPLESGMGAVSFSHSHFHTIIIKWHTLSHSLARAHIYTYPFDTHNSRNSFSLLKKTKKIPIKFILKHHLPSEIMQDFHWFQLFCSHLNVHLLFVNSILFSFIKFSICDSLAFFQI